MGESGAAASSDGGDSSEATTAPQGKPDATAKQVVQVADKGDIILDLNFETSADTLRRTRQMNVPAARRAGHVPPTAPAPILKPSVQVPFRRSLSV